jgi:hypothetical protein
MGDGEREVRILTQHTHRLVWALPITPANRTTIQRLGVAIYSQGYTNAQRLQILNGTLAFDPQDPEALNWQTEYSASDDGSTADYYVGSGSLNATEWARIQARIPFAPSGLKYARLAMNGLDQFELAETNVGALQQFVGSALTEADLIAASGLKPFVAP